MKKLFFLAAVMALPLLAGAQMRVLSNGHIVVGYEKPTPGSLVQGSVITPLGSTLVPDSTKAMTIATENYQNKGGYISFGSGGNVLVGESKVMDNLLDLYSTAGIKYSNPSGLVFAQTYSASNPKNTFLFSVPVSASQYLTSSDARLKRDIKNLEGRGEGLFSLTPVSYKLAVGPQTYSEVAIEGSVAEGIEKQALSNISDAPTVDEYGFLAQEVKEIFPELVVEREDGILMVDYQGMIPLLVDALSTLRAKVDDQEKVIAALTSENSGRRLAPTASSSSLAIVGTSISQNRPNPTTGMTVIDLSVSQDVTNAFVAFYDLTGRQLKRYDISERGKSSLTIPEGEFSPGIYVYALIADGEEVQTRRMVVSD